MAPHSKRSIHIVAAMIAVAFMGSTLITPLYGLYRREFGFSEVTLTLVYAVFVIGNLGALFFFGRISDQIGRRRTSLPAIAIAFMSALFFLFAAGTAWLFLARILSGFAIGILSGTGTAWIADLYGKEERLRATLTTTCANFIGIALGPMLVGPLAEYAPYPLRLSLIIYLACLVVLAIFVGRAFETGSQVATPINQLDLKPRIGIPKDLRIRFIAPAASGFGTFALVGFYAALISTILFETLHQRNIAVAAALVSELFLVAAACIILTRALTSRVCMLSGLALLPVGLALVVTAQALASMPLLVLATAVGGVSAGLNYRGSLQIINQIAPETHRAEIFSSYLFICFIGNSVPVIGVGILSQICSSLVASLVFACTLTIFAIVAVFIGWRSKYTIAATS